MKMAPLIGLVVKLPSNVLWLVVRVLARTNRECQAIDLHRNTVDIGIINEPDDLSGEQLGVVLRRYVSAKISSTASRVD